MSLLAFFGWFGTAATRDVAGVSGALLLVLAAVFLYFLFRAKPAPLPVGGRFDTVERGRNWLRKFLRGHKPALTGFLLLCLVGYVAVGGRLLCEYGPTEAPTGVTGHMPADIHHLFGTDSQGYDLFARLAHGAATTLRIALLATVLSMLTGSLIGAVAGFAGGWTDTLLMRGVDFAMSFPSFLLAMVTVALLGPTLDNLIYAVGVVGAPMFARQVRAEVLRVSAMEYITAATALGVPRARVLFRHVVPNSFGPIIVLGTLGMGSAILTVAGLAFLGMAGEPYQAEWGLILKQGWVEADKGIVQVSLAGVAIFVSVLGFNLLGDGLKDELDPRTRRR
jgi:peptide/nickel transport system permease protein